MLSNLNVFLCASGIYITEEDSRKDTCLRTMSKWKNSGAWPRYIQNIKSMTGFVTPLRGKHTWVKTIWVCAPTTAVEQHLPTRYVIRPDDREEALDVVF